MPYEYNNMKILNWLVSILCIGGLCVLFLWVADQNISFSGYKSIDYVFGDPGPVISELQPVSRMSSKEYNSDGTSFQKMLEDPVYFDLITPLPYQRAKIRLLFSNHTSIPLRLGVRGSGSADYILGNMSEDSNDGRWTEGHIDIDLSQAAWEKGKYRFVLSVPGLVRGNDEEYVALSSINIQLYKDPITFANMKSVATRVLGGIFK